MLDDAGDVEVAFETSQDALADPRRRGRLWASRMSAVVSTVVIGGDGARALVLGEHGGGDADVDASIEELIGGATEARGPGNRDEQVAVALLSWAPPSRCGRRSGAHDGGPRSVVPSSQPGIRDVSRWRLARSSDRRSPAWISRPRKYLLT